MKCCFLARWKKRSLKNSIEHFSWVWGWKCVRLQLSQKVLTSLGLSSYSSSLIVEPHSVAKGQASSRKGRPSSLRSVLSVNKVIPPLLCTLASCTAMLWANLDFKESKKLVYNHPYLVALVKIHFTLAEKKKFLQQSYIFSHKNPQK